MNKRLSVITLAAALSVLLVCHAWAIAPNILPGFPMRAGPMVMLMWSPVPGATQYKVMRKAAGADWQEMIKQPAPPFNDATADPFTDYEYQIIPVVGGADGEASQIAKLAGQKKLEAPKISGTRADPDKVDVRWRPTTGAAFYNVYRAEGEAGPYTLLGSVQDTKYADAAVEPEKTYYYQIAGVDTGSTESPRSETAKVTIPKPAKKVVVIPETYVKWKLVKEVWGEPGYELKNCSDVEISPDGLVHVVDFLSVQVFDKDGNFVRRYGSSPDPNVKWKRPGGIGFSPDGKEVYVSYYAEQLVRTFNAATGAYIEGGDKTYSSTKFTPNPNDVAADQDGNFYIADGSMFQLVLLDYTGTELARVGNPREGYVKGEERPASDLPSVGVVRVSPVDGMVWVAEKTSALVKKLDPAKILAMGPEERTVDVDLVCGGTGPRTENVNGIGNVDFTSDGKVLFLDTLMNKVKVFNAADCAYVESWIGNSDDAAAKKKLDVDFAASFDYDEKSGRLFITSAMLNQVWIFERE